MTATARRMTPRRLRLGAGLLFAAAVLFAPGLSRGESLTLCAAMIAYVVGAAVFDAIAARRPRFPARVLSPLLGLIVIEVVIVAIPRALGVGLVLFLVGVVFSTYLGGLALGLWLSVVAVPGAVLADLLAARPDRIDPVTLGVFAVLVPVLAVVTDRLTAERRRTAGALARLHDALGAAEAQPDLATTLASISTSVRHAVDATVAGVMLRDGDRIVVAAQSAAPSLLTAQEAELFTRAELELGPRSPIGAGLLDRRPLVVGNLDDDDRFADWSTPWAATLRRLGCRSLVLVPLRLGADVIGALAGAFIRENALSGDDVDFLEAFAERASRVVVRARAYDQEREAVEALAQSDREKSEFLALVSHELRTPLTAVKGFVDTVLLHWDRLPEERRRELLDRASVNADELDRVVGQLLDFTRVEAARVRLSPQSITLSDAVPRLVRELTPALAGHRVEVDVHDDAVIQCDTHAFDHIVTNLLTNAAKFSPTGSRIVVLAEPAGAEVVVSVTDEGIGIRPDEQERIFDRFYQSPSNVLSRRGTGIGLTVAKRFVEMQGGRIRVESKLGVGSAFTIAMPASPAPASGDSHARQEVVS